MAIRSPKLGPILILTFAALVALIVGGNGLLVWQFQFERTETERLSVANEQAIKVLRLQQELLTFHQRLADLLQTGDEAAVLAGVDPLRNLFLDQISATRKSVTRLSSRARVNPSFLPTLDAIAIDLTSQIEAVTALVRLKDWGVVRMRLENVMRVMETQIAILVSTVDRDSAEELTQAMTNMRTIQHRILIILPLIAFSTFLSAAFFAWAIMRRLLDFRLEERVAERMRIAGELHDHLLQGVIGAKMMANMALDQLADEAAASPFVKRATSMMEHAINESRDTINHFRVGSRSDEDLGRALLRLRDEFAMEKSSDCHLHVAGKEKPLWPVIRDDVYSIGREALLNAFRHSGANQIWIELEYSAHLRILIRDNGCGIEPQWIESGREGHFGLEGMQERAERIGAKLVVRTIPAGGTYVELRVPGSIAFKDSLTRRG